MTQDLHNTCTDLHVEGCRASASQLVGLAHLHDPSAMCRRGRASAPLLHRASPTKAAPTPAHPTNETGNARVSAGRADTYQDTPEQQAKRATRAEQWRQDTARRAALYAVGGYQALADAGELFPSVARECGVKP